MTQSKKAHYKHNVNGSTRTYNRTSRMWSAQSPTKASRQQRPRRTQAQRRTETRCKLLEAAIRLLQESGFARFTIGQVAARAGVTSGAVQHHFRSSEELLRSVVEAVFPMLDIELDPALVELAIAERVERVIDVYWQKIYGRPDYLVIWVLMFGTRDRGDLQTLLKTLQKRFVAKAVSDLTRVFADVGMRGGAAFRLWTFIGSQLRGLALLSPFEKSRVLEDDLRLLKAATVQFTSKADTAQGSGSPAGLATARSRSQAPRPR